MAIRGWIYDRAILRLTRSWYASVLTQLPAKARVLDVGIGTGSALAANTAIIEDKDMTFVGVDIDPDYVEKAKKVMVKAGLEDRVKVLLESVYDHVGEPYDAIYFSASFMLLPDPEAALEHVKGLLKPDGVLVFTQTFQDKKSKLTERAKPLLKKVTTIDFGTVTYEADFEATLARANVQIHQTEVLGTSGARSYRMVIAR